MGIRRTGLQAESQLPHAVEELPLDALFQMISPRIRKPSSSRSAIRNAWRGKVGLASQVGNIDAGAARTSTRYTSFQTRRNISRYSASERSAS